MARAHTSARHRAGALALATAAVLALTGTTPATAGPSAPTGSPVSPGAPLPAGTAGRPGPADWSDATAWSRVTAWAAPAEPAPAAPGAKPEAPGKPGTAAEPAAPGAKPGHRPAPASGRPEDRSETHETHETHETSKTSKTTKTSGTPKASKAPKGHDVSSHQKRVDWPAARAKGARFVYVKATESTTYRNPYFTRQYSGARAAGLLRGAYHFARPDRSSGAKQAAYFLRHGGDWRADGWTLPPALDIEYNPYDARHKCYGVGKARMVRWIRSFSDEVKRETGRRPVIYTTTQWWKACTGDSRAFSGNHALWIARHGTSRPGKLPGGWRYWTIWQYDAKGRLPGDQNLFNGSLSRLRIFARGR